MGNNPPATVSPKQLIFCNFYENAVDKHCPYFSTSYNTQKSGKTWNLTILLNHQFGFGHDMVAALYDTLMEG